VESLHKHVHVKLTDPTPLDRDIVLDARGEDDKGVSGVVCHRTNRRDGVFCLTVVPTFGSDVPTRPHCVVFVLDTSGSMDGESLPQAKAALRLCLRQLREGDRFNMVSFSDLHMVRPDMAPMTARTLADADHWVESGVAAGGTELLQPMLEAASRWRRRLPPHGWAGWKRRRNPTGGA
jgi:Ca-activated chloride channel family protein